MEVVDRLGAETVLQALAGGSFPADGDILSYAQGSGWRFGQPGVPGAHTHPQSDISDWPLTVARGGTQVVSPTAGNLLIGAAAAAMTLLAPGAASGFVRSDGATWARSTIQVSDMPAHAPASHAHDAADITTGTIPTARTVAKIATVVGGTGIFATGGENPDISVQHNEIGSMGASMVGSDKFVVVDGTVDQIIRADLIDIGIFNDDGTYELAGVAVTAVTGGVGIDSTGGLTPDLSVNLNEVPTLNGMVTTDFIPFVDGTDSVTKKQTISTINVGLFNDDGTYITAGSGVTAVTGSSGIASSGGVTPDITFDAADLNFIASGLLATDHFVVSDGGVSRRATASGIDVGIFNDDGTYLLSGAGVVTDVTAGTGLDSSGGTTPDITVDLNELAVGTALIPGDHLVAVNATSTQKQLISDIPLNIFDNTASGFTSNAGTVTSVAGGTGLLSTGGATPSLSVQHNEIGSMGSSMIGSDKFVVVDGTVDQIIRADLIDIGIFNDDSTYALASHNHAAADVNSGVFAVARIPDLGANKIDPGTFGVGDYVFPDNVQVNGQIWSTWNNQDASDTNITLDTDAGNVIHLDNSQARTITLTNPNNGGTYIISVEAKSGAGAFTWIDTIEWVNGTAPAMSTTVGHRDVIYLLYSDTVWHGSYSLAHN